MRAPALSVCLLVSTIFTATSASAQYTEAQREACTPDVFRLCSQHIPDPAAITACLRREKPRLSAACRGVFARRPGPVANAGAE